MQQNTPITTVSEFIVRGSVTYATGTAGIVHLVIYQDEAVVATRVTTVSGIDFSTDQDLVLTATTADAGDTINVRHAQTVANKAEAGTIIPV